VTAPYDHEALWVKAQLFINRAMDDEESRSFDEQALWAALALELLAKAALARVSPLLVAEPTEDGVNMLIATGLIKGDARFTSVRAATLFNRCHRAFKPFSLADATKITAARNEYLHGSGVAFLTIPQQVWWSRFWAQAAILITACDRDIDEFVGSARAKVVTDHLERNKKYLEDRTETLIERARQRLDQHRAGTLPAKVAAEWRPAFDNSAYLEHRTAATCPACGSDGVLEGDTVSDTTVSEPGPEDPVAYSVVTLTVDADYFSCPTCQLVLNGYEFLDQAELPTSFDVEGDVDDLHPDEPEYGND
jgi:hypothetical protein